MLMGIGLFNKYKISKQDGSPVDPEAVYFVLRIDSDPHARKALREYALSVRGENIKLSNELLFNVGYYGIDDEDDLMVDEDGPTVIIVEHEQVAEVARVIVVQQEEIALLMAENEALRHEVKTLANAVQWMVG